MLFGYQAADAVTTPVDVIGKVRDDALDGFTYLRLAAPVHIKDDQPADELREIEGQPARGPIETRRAIRETIERKYRAPASAR